MHRRRRPNHPPRPAKPRPKGTPAPPALPPPRVRTPPFPPQVPAVTPGRWLWTCRAGFEPHLHEELAWAKARPELLGPAFVQSARPKEPPAFGRMGFELYGELRFGAALDEAARAGLARLCARGDAMLQAWTLDVPALNALSGPFERWVEETGLRTVGPWLASERQVFERGGTLVQLCLVSPVKAVWGAVPAREAVSLSAGGRARMAAASDDLSRAALKLEEALQWLGAEPGAQDRCVDLGAAPGGWTQRLVARGAHVVAVDPAKLSPALAQNRRVKHVQTSAFTFAPDEPVDWLFCDMAWRPLEVAQLLGKWARRKWTLHLVANIKLPMKDKNPALFRVRSVLEEAGWQGVRMRQLYHDRDEVTVTARTL